VSMQVVSQPHPDFFLPGSGVTSGGRGLPGDDFLRRPHLYLHLRARPRPVQVVNAINFFPR
jgi:hypothetical protein